MIRSGTGGAGNNGGKTRFEDIYDQQDPRAYFSRLAPLVYEIPHHAQAVFRRTYAERTAAGATGAPTAVLDLCCSYGINAALLNHDLTLAELYDHYTGPEAARCTTDQLIDWDKEFYASRRRPGAAPVIGLDIAGNALRYALAVGLLDAAFAENLEQDPPSPALRRAVADVGLITLTGGGSYVTHRTFDALLGCARQPIWVSAFVLRTVSYAPIADRLAGHGLRTEADLSITYPQRLFTGPDEQRHAVEAVRSNGADPAGRECAGRYHTTLYESRPR
ncbi:class I SAM-dependent methyltransferase [Streptomyces sannanensis]|uniref:Class I SAM-dependent methyltransferase n=1 Tax=Streptomyces sannanensis TaxID=285536 RepID=A0ABP6SLL0_9ACTN